MTLDQAQISFPIDIMFDKFIAYCSTQPLRPNITPTRQEIVMMVVAAKNMSLLGSIPKYDVLDFTITNIYGKLVEGQSLCSFDPMFCLWNSEKRSIVQAVREAA